MKTVVLAGVLAFAANPAFADYNCKIHFGQKDISRYSEISGSAKSNIYVSWNDGDLIDCQSPPNFTFKCGGKTYLNDASSVYDKNGNIVNIKWGSSVITEKCVQLEDGNYLNVSESSASGTVLGAGIPVQRLIQYTETYSVIKTEF